MNAAIISIGDEITSGQRLDTNSQWIAQQLTDLGLRVDFHQTVFDDMDSIVESIQYLTSRANFVVCTGGLGPTADDLTRQALAQAMGVELELDNGSLEHIKGLFSRRKREMPERNEIQAYFPKGSQPIFNPHGSAPGIHAIFPATGESSSQQNHFFAFPGVPAELKEMWEDSVKGQIESMLGESRKYIMHRCVKCFGVGESDLEQRLPDLIRRGREPSVGITVSKATITLRITATADSKEDCKTQIAETESLIRDCLGDLVFGEQEDELHDVVARELKRRKKKIGVFEVTTKGQISSWFAEQVAEDDGEVQWFGGGKTVAASEYFEFVEVGQELHAFDSKNRLLEFANLCHKEFDADYLIAVGPIEESPTADETENRKVRIAIGDHGNFENHSTPYSGHPDVVLARISKHAINLLRLKISSEQAG